MERVLEWRYLGGVWVGKHTAVFLHPLVRRPAIQRLSFYRIEHSGKAS